MTRRRYGRLTKHAEGAIAAHLEARIAQSLSTEPADRERVERGITACYRFAGCEPPKSILWIDSPAAMVAGPIAAGIIDCWARGVFIPASGRVAEDVAEYVRPYIAGSVPATVIDLVRAAVGSDPSTWARPGDIWYYRSDENLTIALRNACGNAVEEAIRAATGNRLYSRLRDEIGNNRSRPGGSAKRAVGTARFTAKDDARRGNGLPRPLDFNWTIHRTWDYVLHGRAGGPNEGDRCLTSFFRDVVGAAKLSTPHEMWERSRAFDDMRSAGELWPHRGFCIVTHPPVELHLEVVVDEYGYRSLGLHNAAGPAVVWRDGTAQWYLNDTYIDSAPASAGPLQSRLTADRITTMPNAEKRRVLVSLYGRNRYLRDAHAVRLDAEYPPPGNEWTPPTDVRYRALWRLDQPGDEPIVVVDVINQTPEPFGAVADGEAFLAIDGRVWRRYMLRVPPTMTNCAEAVAWTCGKTAATYAPQIES